MPDADDLARRSAARLNLNVEMDQLARPLALVADDLGLGLQSSEAAQPMAAQHQAHRGDRPAEPPRDRRPRQPPPPQRHDLGLGRLAQAPWADVRPRAAVAQTRFAFGGMPGLPLAHGPGGDPESRRDPGDAPAVSETSDHQESTLGRGLGMLVDVHPEAPRRGCWLGSNNLPPQTRVDNLHSNDS